MLWFVVFAMGSVARSILFFVENHRIVMLSASTVFRCISNNC